ncbi:MAG: Rab family GTPase [Candidatus Kariarchaeaceae archaeon]
MIPPKKRAAYKIILIGDPQVGKTSIRKRYLGEGFEQNYMVTLGADFAVKRLGESVLQIWDLAGQDMYKSVRTGYYSGANGVILVYDVVQPKSFENIDRWFEELKHRRKGFIPIVLVANKIDLRTNGSSSISYENGLAIAKTISEIIGFSVPLLESSALTGLNIDAIFASLIEEMDNHNQMQIGL